MSIELRILLVVGSILALSYTFRSIRKSQFKIADTVFWVFFTVVTVVISLFPNIVFVMTRVFSVQSPTNFVFLLYIGLLLYKVFCQSITISKLNSKIETLTQKIAIEGKKNSDRLVK